MRRAIMVLPLLLAGCGGGWPSGSYVRSISDADATVLAPAVTRCLSDTLPSRRDVTLAPTASGDTIAPLLSPLLAAAGFTVAPGGTPVSYVAAPLDDGVLLRVSVNNREGASRFFVRSADGVLASAGPMTVATP
jgi:hypothetical protein